MKYSLWILDTFTQLGFLTIQSKWLKWADSQFGFWTLFINPIYGLSVQIVYPIIILVEDKAIEVRSEITRTRLGC